MATQDDSNDQHRGGGGANALEAGGSKRRLFVLIGLLAFALLALWYDYKVARPAVEQAYDRITAKNDEINNEPQHPRMTNTDVQQVLGRSPSETFPIGIYTIEAYRWMAGMPIEFRGLNGEDPPGIGWKTHDYYAVYRKDGPQLAFITHFKTDLDKDYFVEKATIASTDGTDSSEDDSSEDMMEAMEGGGPPGGGGPGGGGPGGGGPGGGGFDPQVFFTERDVDADGKLAGDEISERMQSRLDTIDTDGDGAVSEEEFLAAMARRREGGGGPGRPGGGPEQGSEGEGRPRRPPLEESDAAPDAEGESSDAPPAADSPEAPADSTTEPGAADPAPDAAKPGDESGEAESSGKSEGDPSE